MAYFLTYQINRYGHEGHISNVILRETHPVVWAANPPEVFKTSGLTNVLLFYAEIPNDLIDEVAKAKWCTIET